MDSITNRQIPQNPPVSNTTSLSTAGKGSGQTATNFSANPENMSANDIAMAAQSAATGARASVATDESSETPPLDTGFIYDSFMNGDTGILARQDNLNKTIAVGYVLTEAQALGQNILNSLLTAVGGTVDSNGTINVSSSNPIYLSGVTVTVSYKDEDGNPATKAIPINEAIVGYNCMLAGIQNAYVNQIRPTAIANNPDVNLPPTLNLPPYLPTFGFNDPSLNATVPTINGVPIYEAPPSVWADPITPAAAQTALQPFESNTSQLVNVSKNFSLAISQQQQKLQNAQQGLSATLKILMSMIMTLLNNM